MGGIIIRIAGRREHPDVEPASELLKRIREERIRRYTEECQKAKAEGRRNPKNIEPQRVETEGIPELHEGWVWTYFNELGELSRGKSKHRPRNDPKLFGGEYPFIQTGDVANSGGVLTKFSQTYNEVGLSQSRLFPEGTVCITIAANIAESSILTFPACFPDSVVGFVPDDILIDGKFFEFYIQTIKDDLSGYAPATAQKNINLKILNRVAIPLPPSSNNAPSSTESKPSSTTPAKSKNASPLQPHTQTVSPNPSSQKRSAASLCCRTLMTSQHPPYWNKSEKRGQN